MKSSRHSAMLVLLAPLLTGCAQPHTAPPNRWGRLANPGFENERIKTTLFFAGQARDGSAPYDCEPRPNMNLYTVHPRDKRHLNWSKSRANRAATVDEMIAAGI